MMRFRPLEESDFPLLLKWLKMPHVHEFWDPDIDWTAELVKNKYTSYVGGYAHDAKGDPKPIHACIIEVDGNSVGYIQGYNAYDFEHEVPLKNLPKSLMAFDVLIGDPDYLKKGLASQAITHFLETYFSMYYDYAFADPETANQSAIHAYEKAGFKIDKHIGSVTWMLKPLRG